MAGSQWTYCSSAALPVIVDSMRHIYNKPTDPPRGRTRDPRHGYVHAQAFFQRSDQSVIKRMSALYHVVQISSLIDMLEVEQLTLLLCVLLPRKTEML